MKTPITLAALTTLMLLAVVACTKKEDAKNDKPGETTTTSAAVTSAKASCNMLAELGTCNEYKSGATLGLEKSLCEGFHGKFANTGCSTEGQIGSCLMSDGEVKRYYGSKVAGDHALSVEEAKGDCESESVKGKFTADPSVAPANTTAPEDPKAVAKPAPKAAAKPAVKTAIKKK